MNYSSQLSRMLAFRRFHWSVAIVDGIGDSRALALGLLLLLAQAAVAAPENIARGKSYTLDPAPNYAHCTDPGDVTQLTDGKFTEGHFWTQASTVGWSGVAPILVTVDLGQVQPIRGATWSTAAGVAGVEWPRSITILVSDDGQKYFEAGDLVALSSAAHPPPEGDYALHQFTTDQLKTHGRFVQFLVAPSGGYCFADEVEVLKGESDWTSLSLTGEAITDTKAHYRATIAARKVQRRIRNDRYALLEAIEQADIPAAAKKTLATQAGPVDQELDKLPGKLPSDFRCVLPLNPMHDRMFATQAALWRAQGAPPLTAWMSGPWDPLPLFAPLPTATAAPPVKIEMSMMQNEYRAAAFNLSLAADAVTRVQLQFAGLPGKARPPWVSVHEVAWTDTGAGRPVAAALLPATPQGKGYQLELRPGLTRQVWLTFHPTNLAAGVYRGSVLILTDRQKLRVPLKLEIYPFRFPDAPTLHLGGWDYTDQDKQYEITPENRSAVIAHLREHFVDSPWATSAVLPYGHYDGQGKLTTNPDTSTFDRWLQRWPAARQYCVFAAVSEELDGTPMGTSLFEKKAAAWIRFWTNHARQRGVKPGQLTLLLVDEPTEAKQDLVILAWAKAIRAADTGVVLWEDPCHKDPAAANQEMMGQCHVICPQRPVFLKAKPELRDYYVRMAKQGAQLAFYSCSGPARSMDPYSYYRLQAWSCWQYHGNGSYFWAFGDGGGGSSWNEYPLAGAAYVPYFLDANSVTAGKHMEAIREGIEDFEYLHLLSRRVDQFDQTGRKPAALARAKALLAEAAQKVCEAPGAKSISWSLDKDRTVADQVRHEVLETLRALR